MQPTLWQHYSLPRGIDTNLLASHGGGALPRCLMPRPSSGIGAEFAAHNDPSGTVIGTPDRISAKAADVVPDSDVLILPLPSFAYASVLKELKPCLHKGMYIGVTPEQGGFDWVAREILGNLVEIWCCLLFYPCPLTAASPIMVNALKCRN